MPRSASSEDPAPVAWRQRAHEAHATIPAPSQTTSEGSRGASGGSAWSQRLCVPDLGVPLFFELLGEILVSGSNDLAIDQDVHDIRHDVIEQALIVRDDQHRPFG